MSQLSIPDLIGGCTNAFVRCAGTVLLELGPIRRRLAHSRVSRAHAVQTPKCATRGPSSRCNTWSQQRSLDFCITRVHVGLVARMKVTFRGSRGGSNASHRSLNVSLSIRPNRKPELRVLQLTLQVLHHLKRHLMKQLLRQQLLIFVRTSGYRLRVSSRVHEPTRGRWLLSIWLLQHWTHF